MIDTLWKEWNRFADLTCDPKFIRRLRRAVGLLALAVTISWFVSCTALGVLAANVRGQEPTPIEGAYYVPYLPLMMKDVDVS